MRKWKTWLLERFLPAWAKDSVYRENKALQAKIAEQKQEIRELSAYIDGLEAGLRSMRRIVVQAASAPWTGGGT